MCGDSDPHFSMSAIIKQRNERKKNEFRIKFVRNHFSNNALFHTHTHTQQIVERWKMAYKKMGLKKKTATEEQTINNTPHANII